MLYRKYTRALRFEIFCKGISASTLKSPLESGFTIARILGHWLLRFCFLCQVSSGLKSTTTWAGRSTRWAATKRLCLSSTRQSVSCREWWWRTWTRASLNASSVYVYVYVCIIRIIINTCCVLIRPPIPYITSSRCKRLHKFRPIEILLHKRTNPRAPPCNVLKCLLYFFC